MRIELWLESEMVRFWPLIGSGSESENGIADRVWGSRTETMDKERVSRWRGPERGLWRERRAEA